MAQQENKQMLSVLKIDNKGWNTELFVNKIDSLCEKCHLVCCNPAELACDIEHKDDDICTFCNDCLVQLIKERDGNCPIDGHKNPIIYPLRSLKRKIYKSLVMCPFSIKYKQKIKNNNQQIIDTIGNDEKEGVITNVNDEQNGCNFQGNLKELIDSHLIKCTQKYNPLYKYIIEIKKLENEKEKLNEIFNEYKQKKEIEINKLKKENGIFLAQITQTNATNDMLKENIQNCQIDIDNKYTENEILNKENESMKKLLNESSDEITALKIALNALRNINNSLKTENATLQRKLNENDILKNELNRTENEKQIDDAKKQHLNKDIFDKQHCHVSYSVSWWSRTTITKNTSSKGIAYCQNIIPNGICEWKFKIIKACGAHIVIGVWKTKCKTNTDIYLDSIGAKNKSYGLDVIGKWLTRGDSNDIRKYGIRCKEGDIISMILNVSHRTLSYRVNDVSCGIAYTNIEKTSYKACIDMWTKDDCIQLLS